MQGQTMDKGTQKKRAQITNVDTGIKKEQMQTIRQAVRWAHRLNTQKGKQEKIQSQCNHREKDKDLLKKTNQNRKHS